MTSEVPGPREPRRGLRIALLSVSVVLVLIAGAAVAWSVAGKRGGAEGTAVPATSEPATIAPPVSPSESPKPSPEPKPGADGLPINPDYPGLTTLRGNWHRNFYGIGPVPKHPDVKWKVGPWCGTSTEGEETKQWCGTGWNGQPNVIPTGNGDDVEVRIGGYDYDYHFLDGLTGKETRPPLKTRDLAKGSATSDPDGCPLYYAGSRDNLFRIVSLAQKKPKVLWTMDADRSVPDPRWNNDWDGAAQIVGDYMLVGGENSWFYVVKLNKKCTGGHASVNPRIVFSTPGWDAQFLQQARTADIGIENSVAYDDKTKTAYFGNSGGLVQGWNISKILKGGTQANRTFRFWMGGENDASIVMDDEGYLYASSHYEPGNQQAVKVGQLVKLDPHKNGNPVVWSLKETNIADGDAGFFSTPAIVGDTIFASATGGDFMAIDKDTGKVFWRERLTPPLWSAPAVVDDTLVIGDCSGKLYAFDVKNPKKKPKQLWQITLGGCIESTPAIWDGMIYVGTRAGYFYGIGDKNPKKLEHNAERQASPKPPKSPKPAVTPSAGAAAAA